MGSPKSRLERSILAQVVYLGGDPRKHAERVGGGETGMGRKQKGPCPQTSNYYDSQSHWGNSESQQRTHLRVIPAEGPRSWGAHPALPTPSPPNSLRVSSAGGGTWSVWRQMPGWAGRRNTGSASGVWLSPCPAALPLQKPQAPGSRRHQQVQCGGPPLRPSPRTSR